MIPRYTRPAMGKIWKPAAQYGSWLEVELAAAEAMTSLGLIPEDVMETLRAATPPDPDRVDEIERRTGHDVIAFLEALEEQVGPAARFLHLGMTSSDVLDTSLALRCTRSCDLLIEGCENLVEVMTRAAIEHRDQPMVGRSHGIHAEPITFGLKILGWREEFQRGLERLRRARDVIAHGQISGAVGTYNTVDPEVERRACSALGLEIEPVSTQVVPRDRHAEMLSHLAIVAAAVERVATEIRGLQRTEVREVEEPFRKGQKGSSVMPHKRNPIKCENLVGLARLVRAYAGTGFENIALWHERDISHSSVERVTIADSFILVDLMLHRLGRVVEDMHVYPENMQRNLDLTHGLVFSSRVLERLIASGTVRTEAYTTVQRAAMRCWKSQEAFEEVLAEDPTVIDALGRDGLREAFDVKAALTYCDVIFERVLGREVLGRDVSGERAERAPDDGDGPAS